MRSPKKRYFLKKVKKIFNFFFENPPGENPRSAPFLNVTVGEVLVSISLLKVGHKIQVVKIMADNYVKAFQNAHKDSEEKTAMKNRLLENFLVFKKFE